MSELQQQSGIDPVMDVARWASDTEKTIVNDQDLDILQALHDRLRDFVHYRDLAKKADNTYTSLPPDVIDLKSRQLAREENISKILLEAWSAPFRTATAAVKGSDAEPTPDIAALQREIAEKKKEINDFIQQLADERTIRVASAEAKEPEGTERGTAVIIARWIAVLPTAIVAMIAVTFPIHWAVMFTLGGYGNDPIITIDDSDQLAIIERFFYGLIVPATFVCAGSAVAPRHRRVVAVVLAVVAATAMAWAFYAVSKSDTRSIDGGFFKLATIITSMVSGVAIVWHKNRPTPAVQTAE